MLAPPDGAVAVVEAMSAAVTAGTGGVGKSDPTGTGFSGAGDVVTGGESILVFTLEVFALEAAALACAVAGAAADADGAGTALRAEAPPRSGVIKFEYT